MTTVSPNNGSDQNNVPQPELTKPTLLQRISAKTSGANNWIHSKITPKSSSSKTFKQIELDQEKKKQVCFNCINQVFPFFSCLFIIIKDLLLLFYDF